MTTKKPATKQKLVDIKIIDRRLINKIQDIYYDSNEFVPAYQTSGAAGLDLRAMPTENIVLKPGERQKIPSGVSIHIKDPSLAGFVFPRSGLGSNGLVLANSVGVIDSDYTGVIQLVLFNNSKNDIVIKPFDRVAQLIIMPITRITWNHVLDFDTTERNYDGFGSTGISG